jgi:flagellin-like protein
LKALRREGRRGVSPVIATLLLIVIAVAAAVLVYMWTVGYATQMRPTTPEAYERLKIEAGNLTIVNDNVIAILYVRNVGSSPTYINGSYLLTTDGSAISWADASYIYVDSVGAKDMPLNPGTAYKVGVIFKDVAKEDKVKAGHTYVVRIVTSLGNEFGYEMKLRPSA